MNYRHAFHAGNFADVMKHLALTRVFEHLKHKEKPFCFVDTHAGAGIYDLTAGEATRSGEWRQGIAKLLPEGTFELPSEVPDDLRNLINPYLAALHSTNAGNSGLLLYPGAGALARQLLRPQDRLVLNELHPEDVGLLKGSMRRDPRVRVLNLDGWTVVKSVLPPKERRGVMLIDPPFEQPGEFSRLEAALKEATDRFATGISVLWYPIKAGGQAEGFVKRMTDSKHKRLLCAELLTRHRDTPQGLNGSGLLIHNPPYGLDDQLRMLLEWLSACLSQGPGASSRVEWLTGE